MYCGIRKLIRSILAFHDDTGCNHAAMVIAAYLQLVIKSQDLKQVHQSFQERLRHLSFLVHLLCRYDDFDSIFQEYKIVQVGDHGILHLNLTNIHFCFSGRLRGQCDQLG